MISGLGLYEYLILAVSTLSVLCVRKLTAGPSHPILNVYQQRGNFYWAKVIVAFIYLAIKKAITDWEKLEKPRKLRAVNKARDGTIVDAFDEEGNHLIARIFSHGNGIVSSNIFVKLGTKWWSIIETQEHSNCRIAPIEESKVWKVEYEGKLKGQDGEEVEAVISGHWSSKLPRFHYEIDGDSWLLAKAIAKEIWNWDYFITLKMLHYTQYEQPGRLEGTIKINNSIHEINMEGIRSRFFGRQMDLKHIHRRGFHYIALENGDRIGVGMLSTPITFSCLHQGYIYSVRTGGISSIKDCDLELYQHGERGNPPLDYAFSFKANGKKYVVQVEIINCPEFYLGHENEVRLIQGLCKFTVNGRKGWGTSEWLYRNVGNNDSNKK